MNLNILKLKEVIKKTAISRSSLYSKIQRGKFPQPLKLGERASGWIEDEIDEWIEQLRLEREVGGSNDSSH